MIDFAELKTVLAPMYRVGSPAFRARCESAGADLSYHVMLAQSPPALVDAETLSLSGKPTAVQLIGSDPRILANQAAALEAELKGALALIDINLGCPLARITGLGAGAALMQDMPLIERLLKAVVAAVDLPVTAKIRKGYSDGEDRAVELAQRAEACGIAAICVHGRTAAQQFEGVADKTVVGRVKQALAIPVFASGDVLGSASAIEYLHTYGADAVMVARGARDNPAIFGEIKRALC
ncbi:MAG: tRNA-dihydrouridine synthase family protein [Coriobacteriales bacterium]|nr:tRNA-dihydrouridine synthase family protein [Coriobacteriales bacterium]